MTVANGLRVGFVSLARSTFDVALAGQVTTQLHGALTSAGLQLCGPGEPLRDPEALQAAVVALAADPPDLLLLLQATFADSTMVLRVAEAVDAPLVLWAVPEPTGSRSVPQPLGAVPEPAAADAAPGGPRRLRLNSLCGVNLAAHALRRAGRRYDWLYAPPDDPAALQKVCTLALAGHVRQRLRQARIGRVGEQPAGFPTCSYDAERLRAALGVQVVPLGLDAVFQAVRAVGEGEVDAAWQALESRLEGLAYVDRAATRRTLAVQQALGRLAAVERLDGLAVRCWPEFFTDLGCAACGALSQLADGLIPTSCEADVNGTITQFILQCLSGGPAFGSDIVSMDVAAGTGVLWHCGLAPLSMADRARPPRATVHPNRKLPLLFEFSLKPGRVTLARLSEASGGYRLVIAGGEMLQSAPSFSGTSGVLRFDAPASDVLDTIMREGLEHHVSLTYGDHRAALLALGAMLGLPVLRL